MSKQTAADLVSEAHSQGMSDGHALNRPSGVADELRDAEALDAERAMLLAALQRVGCQDKGSCGADDVDGLCFVCRAIETAVRS